MHAVSGVDTANLLISQPDTGRQALEICEMLVRSGAIGHYRHRLGCGVGAESGDRRRNGRFARGAAGAFDESGLAETDRHHQQVKGIVILSSQLREKVGIMFGNPETTTGGRALKFYSSVRIDIRKGEAIKQGTDIIINRTRAKIVKNKVAPPFRLAEFDMMYGTGISREGTLIDIGANMDIIQKSGSWYSYRDERMGQGKENAKGIFAGTSGSRGEIEKLIRDTLVTNRSFLKKAN